MKRQRFQFQASEIDWTWSDKDLALIETSMDQVAQTAENLRLFEETRQRADYERLTSEITREIRQAPNLEVLAKMAAESLSNILDVSDRVVRLDVGEKPG